MPDGDSLPRRPRAHVIGDEAVQAVQRILPAEWLYRPVSPDYGIDGEIEIVDGEEVTGGILKAQVKGRQRQHRIYVPASVVRYWLNLPVPVVIIRVEVGGGGISWIDVFDYVSASIPQLYAQPDKSIPFDFSLAHSLP